MSNIDSVKIATGSTTPEDWVQYGGVSGEEGIAVRIDTSAAGFTKTPVYVTSLHGKVGHHEFTGINAIYEASPTGFLIIIKFSDGRPFPIEKAKDGQYFIKWVGIE